MAYFLILPAFVLWLLVAAAGILATRLIPRLAPIYPYALRASLWASVGTVVANAVLIGLLALGMGVLEPTASQSTAQDAAQMAWGLTALGGPVIASALGWLGGFVFGLFLAFRRSRRLSFDDASRPKPLGGSA